MNLTVRLLMLLIFLITLTLLGNYLYRHLLPLFPTKSALKTVFTLCYVLLWIVFFAGLLLEHQLSPTLGGALAFVGYSFILVVMYLLLTYLAVDIVRLVLKLTHIHPVNPMAIRRTITLASLVLIGVSMVAGYIHFNHPVVRNLELTVNKPLKNKSVKIVLASDIHLGNSIGKDLLKQYVKLINEQEPDIILLGGDITDRSIGPLNEQNLNEELSQLKARLGVYAVLGNHEHYSGHPDRLVNYFEKAGIHMLRDQVVLIDSSFYVIGREDRTSKKRLPLRRLTEGLNPSIPTIVLDHQPYQLEEASNLDIDLQLSGHTHNGQVFPGNLLVKQMFEDGYGYLLKKHTHVYVSSGLGIWGPLYRIGTRSEVVSIRLHY